MRKTREEMGLRLEDIQEQTKIRMKYLRALEDGEDEKIPGEVYARGFLRTYANCLGLNGEELAGRYRETKETQCQEGVPTEETPEIKILVRQRDGGGLRGRALVIAAVLLLLIGAVVGGGIHLLGNTPATPAVQDPAGEQNPTVNNAHETEQPPPGEESPLPVNVVETSRDVMQAEYLVSGAEDITVQVHCDWRCWLQVRADGELIYEGSFGEDEQQNFAAQERLWIRLGNPSAITLTANGVELGRAGAADQPLNVVFERETE
ncbi:MAG: helix-turn-helix domain-containing protein [Bacillota bacterium]